MITILLTNLLPLYILIALGYIAGRWLKADLESFASVLIFILAPIVFFGAIVQIEFTPAYLLLPVILGAMGISIAVGSLYITKRYFTGNEPNLIAMLQAAGNTGYFALPLILVLFGAEGAAIYMLGNIGIAISQTTVGYYFGARGNHSIRESIIKVLKLPSPHMLWVALLWQSLNLPFPPIAVTYWEHFTGAWIIIGIMLIGMALGKYRSMAIDKKLLGWLFGIKFIIWPLIAYGFVLLDKLVLGLFDNDVHIMILIIGIVPLPANGTSYALHLKVKPEEATVAILLSTIFALFYIPAVFWLLGISI